VIGGALLAHVAMRGGEVAVENALGQAAIFDPKTVPWCVYTDPEIASVGLTEAQARETGHDVQVGRFPLNASGRAVTCGETDGFVKVISEARFGELFGLHIVAPHVCDLVHVGGLALALEATLDELVTMIHAHPTLPEAMPRSNSAGAHCTCPAARRNATSSWKPADRSSACWSEVSCCWLWNSTACWSEES
jgi:dihydrolipoamide dehydrogenase